MSDPQPPFWLTFVSPVVAIGAVLWAFGKRVLLGAVREEIRSLHKDNQMRLISIEKRLGRIEGHLFGVREER